MTSLLAMRAVENNLSERPEKALQVERSMMETRYFVLDSNKQRLDEDE